MAKKSNLVTCLNFEGKELNIIVVDQVSEKVTWRKSFTYNFIAQKNSGAIASPSLLASFIQGTAKEHNLPHRIRYSLSLRYIDLKRIYLPVMPLSELNQIIQDEASRESIFSYAGDKIAVSYKILGNQIGENGAPNMEILVATTPQEVIDSIIETFQETKLKLEAIQPSLIGLERVLKRRFPDFDKSYALIYTGKTESEFCIWEQQTPQFWRYLTIGSSEPERLHDELVTSLEHFSGRSNNASTVHKLIMVGEGTSLGIFESIDSEYLPGEKWTPLLGLGMKTKDEFTLSFIKGVISGGSLLQWPLLTRLWPVALGILMFINVLIGWHMWLGFKVKTTALFNNANLWNQYSILQKKVQNFNAQQGMDNNFKFETNAFLENIRTIVPSDIRFNELNLDITNNTMLLEGVSLSQRSMADFVREFIKINGVKSIEIINSTKEKRKNYTIFVFKLNIVLEQTNG